MRTASRGGDFRRFDQPVAEGSPYPCRLFGLEFAKGAKIKEGLLVKWNDPGKGRASKLDDFRRYEFDIPEEHKMAAQSLLIHRKSLDEKNGIEINLSEPNQILDFSQSAIASALRAGLFRIRPLEFPSTFASKLSNINDFSAGQWGLFSSLPAVALQCVDRTLLLVDEPESALHPGWQRTYIEDLTEAISHRKECHVFIATHSPLIVGSLGTKLTDLISLKKNPDDGTDNKFDLSCHSFRVRQVFGSSHILDHQNRVDKNN